MKVVARLLGKSSKAFFDLIAGGNDPLGCRPLVMHWHYNHNKWFYMPITCGMCISVYGMSKRRKNHNVNKRPASQRLAPISVTCDLEVAEAPVAKMSVAEVSTSEDAMDCSE